MKQAKRMRRILALTAVLAVVMVACGDDDAATTTTAAATTTSAAVTTTAAETTTTAPGDEYADFNGDGQVLIGVATDGPRDDGSYYQALVDKVIEISTEFGFADPIIVDLIDPANAETELRNIAEQGVDILMVGSSAVGEPIPTLLADFPDIFWYCNCGSGYPVTDGLLISLDRGAELWISGGYAAGLLMQETGGTTAAFLGCCELPFETESFDAFVYGMQLVDPTFTATYTPTGAFPFDFNNTAAATEAFNGALAEGVSVVVPFLGGAHEPIVQLANDNDLIVMSAGSSKACERTDLAYDFEVKFDGGDYVDPILRDIIAGTAQEGTAREFHVGLDDVVGAEFCDATPDQVAALDAINAQIGAGDFAEDINAIVANAYGF
jgi:basic membrane protein A